MSNQNAGYIKPDNVVSPKGRFKKVDILYDGGEGDWAMAIGFWDDHPTLFLRFNGTNEQPLGQPSSRGYPSFMVMPDPLWAGALEFDQIEPSKRVRAKALLGLE